MDARDTTGCARTDDDIPTVPPVVWDPNCSCLVCLAFVDPWAMHRLERLIMDDVHNALVRGWSPTALVGEVGRRALRGPFAEEIVTIALIHDVGLTVPGWLERYGTDEVEVDLALDGVVDLIEILSSLSDPPPSRRRRTLRSVRRD